jgi:protein-tyrosine phosphatase
VLNDTVRLIETLRAEGRTVLVHCVQAYSRTPTIAALYSMRRRTVSAEAAIERVRTVLPGASPNADFRAALQEFDATT